MGLQAGENFSQNQNAEDQNSSSPHAQGAGSNGVEVPSPDADTPQDDDSDSDQSSAESAHNAEFCGASSKCQCIVPHMLLPLVGAEPHLTSEMKCSDQLVGNPFIANLKNIDYFPVNLLPCELISHVVRFCTVPGMCALSRISSAFLHAKVVSLRRLQKVSLCHSENRHTIAGVARSWTPLHGGKYHAILIQEFCIFKSGFSQKLYHNFVCAGKW